MKKIFACFSLICLALVLFGCGEVPKITCNYDKIEIALNGEFSLQKSDFVVDDDYNIAWQMDSNDFVKMEDNKLYPLKAGAAFLRVYLQEKPEIFILIGVRVNDEFLTENAKPIKTKVSINLMENNINFNKIIIDERSNEIPQIQYDDTIIDFNYSTGEIVGKSVGKTEVKVTYSKCFAVFEVEVTNKVYATYMQVENVEVLPKSKGKFEFLIFPDNANTYVFYSNDTTIKVEPSGEYEVLGDNSAIVYYYYFRADGVKSNTKSFKVSVVEPIENFEIYIEDALGNRVEELEQNKAYRFYMVLSGVENHLVSFSSNMVISSLVNHDNDLSYIVFYMGDLGEQEISVKYWCNVAGQMYVITETMIVNVIPQ